jgi:predicted PurR-regulated permease PerM
MNGSVLQDFQRNVSFIVIVIVGGLALLVYLVSSLAGLLVPLFWACFFAVPLTALITRIDRLLTKKASELRWHMEGGAEGHHPEPERPYEFTGQAGDNSIVLAGADAKHLLQKLAHPGGDTCGAMPGSKYSKCCQSRIRIIKLTDSDSQSIAGDEVDRLVENWLYYVKEPDDDEVNAISDVDQVQLELFHDQECSEYPSVMKTAALSVRDSQNVSQKLKGVVEIDRTSALSWSVSVTIAMFLLATVMFIFFLAASLGVDALQEKAHIYSKGVTEMIDWFAGFMGTFMPPAQINKMKGHMQGIATQSLPGLAATASGKIESLGFDLLLFVLYILFWVFEPIPISSNVAQVIKDYLLLKSVACLIYAFLMGAMLYFLGCPLWHLFFVMSFLLNYIPEFGFIVIFILVIPAVVFNSEHSMQRRETDTVIVIIGAILIKILVANVLEVYMYVSRGGQYMRMHPVVLLGLMMFFEKFFGLSGMFLAIPMVAIVKYYLLSADIPTLYLNPALALLEGDDTAPHKNFVDRKKANLSYGTTGDTEPPETSGAV